MAFVFHLVSKRNSVGLRGLISKRQFCTCTGCVHVCLSVKIPLPFTKVLNQICWKVLLWAILVSHFFSGYVTEDLPRVGGRFQPGLAEPGLAELELISPAARGCGQFTWGLAAAEQCSHSLRAVSPSFCPLQWAGEEEGPGESTQPGQLAPWPKGYSTPCGVCSALKVKRRRRCHLLQGCSFSGATTNEDLHPRKWLDSTCWE